MDTVVDPSQQVDRDLVVLEAEQSGIRAGYDFLIKWLREDNKVGERFGFSDGDPRNIRSTAIHAIGRGKAGENAAVLVFEVWRDHAIHIQPLGIFRWVDWSGWSDKEKEAVIRQRLG
jgi:hypothetical protein